MATQYQLPYAPYAAVPSQGPILQPPQPTTCNGPPSQGPILQPPQPTTCNGLVLPTHEQDYLAYSLLTLIFCCLPLGTVALVFSVLTRDANQRGNGVEAQWNSRTARRFAHSALGVGIVLIITICVLKYYYYY